MNSRIYTNRYRPGKLYFKGEFDIAFTIQVSNKGLLTRRTDAPN